MMPNPAPSRLHRQLNLTDAVILGLGAMVGAGIFSALAPAAQAAGRALPLALLLAAGIAYLNAKSVARLAVLYPESGGVYVYGERRLGRFWGFLAGWSFVIGKLASCAAMAMTFATYVAPNLARPTAVAAVMAVTLVNCLGIQKTLSATKLILLVVLVSLAAVVFAGLSGGAARPERIWPWHDWALGSLLEAAGILFFAFAGYARVATLGEEVKDPARTIPRAISLALGISLAIYTLIVGTALITVDTAALAQSRTPLTTVVESGSWASLSPLVRLGAGVASWGVLLSLFAGIGRTIFAMGANGDLPRFLAKVHPVYKVPHRAELAAGIVVCLATLVADLRGAIGFSSFAILTYYAIGNAAAITLSRAQLRGSRWMPVTGLTACLIVAFHLPTNSITGGLVLLILGALVFHLRKGAR